MASAAWAPKTTTKMVKLSSIPAGAGVKFLEAEVFVQPDIPFAIIFYSLNGIRQEDGLRADLDKQIFLDHFDDPDQEKVAARAAPLILDKIFDFFEAQTL